MQRNRKWYAGLLVIAALAFSVVGMGLFAAQALPSGGPAHHGRTPLTAAQIQTLHQMRSFYYDQSSPCQGKKPEGLGLMGYNFFTGSSWVGTNGSAVIWNNGLNLSFASASNLANPGALDVLIFDNVYQGHFVGNTAYLLESNAIDVWDVTDPANPAEINYLSDCLYSGDTWNNFDISGHYAYIAAGSTGLIVMDLNGNGAVLPSNTYAPSSTVYSYAQIQVVGHYALAFDPANGIDVWDISNPANVVRVANYPLSGFWTATVGTPQFVYSSPNLYIIDPSATAPQQVYSYSWPDFGVAPYYLNSNSSTTPTTGEEITSVALNGTNLLLSTPTGAYTASIVTPQAISISSYFKDDFHGDNYGVQVASAGNVNVLADYAGVASFDANGNRTGYFIDGSEVTDFSPIGAYANTIAASPDGSLFAVTVGYEGVVLTDASGNRLGFFELPTPQSEVIQAAFTPDGKTLLVTSVDATSELDSTTSDQSSAPSLSSMAIVDVTNPAAPTLLGNYTPAGGFAPEWITPLTGTQVVLTECDSSSSYQIETVDFSVPQYPMVLGSLALTGMSAVGIPAVAGTYTSGNTYLVYPATISSAPYLQAVDITKPASPALSKNVALSGEGSTSPTIANAVAAANENNHWFAFVGTDTGIATIDLANVAAGMNEIGFYTVPNLSDFNTLTFFPGGSPAPQLGAGGIITYTDTHNQVHHDPIYMLLNAYQPKFLSKLRSITDALGVVPYSVTPVADGSNSDLYVPGFGMTIYKNVPDYTAPTIAGPGSIGPTPYGGIINSPETLTVQGVSDDVGVAAVIFYAELPCGAHVKLGTVTQPTAPGTYSFVYDPSTNPAAAGGYAGTVFQARAMDAGYNVTPYFTLPGSFTIQASPSVTIVNPAATGEGSCGLVGLVPIAVKAQSGMADGTIVRVQVLVDGTSLGDATQQGTSWVIPWNTAGVTDGTHQLTAEAMDSSSLFSTSPAVSVLVANNGTPVQVASPLAGSQVTGTVNLSVTPASACVQSVSYYLDRPAPYTSGGTLIGSSTTAPDFSASWDTSTAPYGNHALIAVSLDSNGKKAISPVVSFTTFQPQPLVVSITTSPASPTDATPVTAVATVTGGSVPYTYAWTVDGTAAGSNSPSITQTLAAGDHTFGLTVTDNAGATQTASASVTVAPSTPPITPPAIAAVSKAGSPFRLKVSGSNFQSGAVVKINGTAVTTVFKSASLVVAKQCKSLCPKGTAVQVTVTNPDGGVSAAASFTR